ncbi:alpha/beta hydrolase [Brachybacterium sp. p3-SID1565]|uniref:alpha/beta hydrolase n=1 Tax=Brachybacterium sp. p3-SID1565 TaxID=2916046 RepID=UPI0021A92D8A|nr:alpha/beta hydrolase [Brachybacterium sp. p3-SID1565]MCT1384030.1 alpha/beta hydrolase [Brachybacterium sp. p3-SID1565]
MTIDPVFGDGYAMQRIDLGADAEGPLVATLVHRLPERPDSVPILVGHGWSDYVLDRELLEHLAARGLDVWALDLRKHGRSLLPGQTPTEIDHLNRYDEEIDAALRIIGRDRPPIMLAHSTGGLTAALWAVRHPGTIRALALNSPWLEMHLGAAVRRLLSRPVSRLAGRLNTRPLLPQGVEHYARSVHRDYGGLYDYDLALKPPGGHPFPADTFAAVIDGQSRLESAGPLAIPVLVMHSARSVFGMEFTEAMRRADSVLDVKVMAEAAAQLGPDVRIEAIEGARHDVFLSDADARHRAIEVLDDWLDVVLTGRHTMSGRGSKTERIPPVSSSSEGAG